MRIKAMFLFLFILIFSGDFHAQSKITESVKGIVADSLTKQPMEFVNVTLLNTLNDKIITGAITGKKGEFKIENIPTGNYKIKISYVGYNTLIISNIIVGGKNTGSDLGTLYITNRGITLNETEVTANKIMLNNSIDRKIYNVKEDVLSTTGTASDLLQNIPSVQVDLDGNVSLRGSADVMILINGSSNPLMGKTRAEVLKQMPASSIEKIEVITNPSARYKPDGTSGIINIIMKKESNSGLNGNIGINAGPDDRYNGNISLNYNTGGFNLFGNLSLRKDNRYGFSSDYRTQFSAPENVSSRYKSEALSHSRPVSTGASLGVEYNPGGKDKFGISGNMFHRGKVSTDVTSYIIRDINYFLTENYDRTRHNDEYEDEYGMTAFYEHKFNGDDHNLNIQYNFSYSPEVEDNRYKNVYSIPAVPNTFDNTLLKMNGYGNQIEVQYSNPLTENSTLEAGYAGEMNKNDLDFYGEFLDPVKNTFVTDIQKTNHFIYTESVHAAYATYSNSFGSFGFLGGLRLEGAFIKSNLVSANTLINNDYYNIYPTLHLSYKLTDLVQFQLNYSKRARRPEGEDLNPFPEYQDPRNVRAGNPNLKPEFTHSLEFGVQWNNKLFTIIPSVFYRNRYNAMTTVTKAINDSTLLTTRENLANDHSAGFEFVLSGGYDFITVNMSTMAFLEEIDAANLGYPGKKSTTTWSGNLSCNFNLPSSFMVQVNSNYRSSRLTPQGNSSPSFVLNLGMRKDFMDGKLTLILTISDLLKTLDRKSALDTDWLRQNTYGVRDSQIFFLGVTYHLGKQGKKAKDLQYDNSI